MDTIASLWFLWAIIAVGCGVSAALLQLSYIKKVVDFQEDNNFFTKFVAVVVLAILSTIGQLLLAISVIVFLIDYFKQ